jgi:molybdate transport system permease protein
MRITLPLAYPGLLAGVVLSLARALGEFGATLMIAGNIPGKTQTIPLAIYFAVETGDNLLARNLVLVITAMAVGALFWLNSWSRKKLQTLQKGGDARA